MKNKHAPCKTEKEKRLSSGDERQRERVEKRERERGGGSFTATQLSYLQGVEKPFFSLLQEDEKILLKPTGSAIIFGQLEH